LILAPYEPSAGDKILDVGTGSGTFLFMSDSEKAKPNETKVLGLQKSLPLFLPLSPSQESTFRTDYGLHPSYHPIQTSPSRLEL
jgi:hypothetical protein